MKLEVKKQDYFGRGISKLEGKTVFIEKSLPGEYVNIEIINEKKNYIEAKNKDFVNNTLCRYYDKCGGCNILHQKYIEQLKFKENKVREMIERNNLGNIKVNDIVYDKEYGYRNKIILHAKNKKLGFYSNKSNDIVRINKCLLVDDRINNVINEINSYLVDNYIDGEIKIRCSSKEIMISIKGKVDADVINYLTCDVLIINGKSLKDKDYIIEELNDLIFKVSEDSFYQVNRYVVSKLYNEVINNIKDNNYNNALDLYCGTGTITLELSKYVDNVTGIEVVKSAIDDALYNKEINGIDKVNFICGKVEDYIDKFKDIDLVVVDPPRSGLDNKTRKCLLEMKAKTICYVSCGLDTLVRDLKELSNCYDILSITPVDMFPNTYHVENVVILELR